MALAPKRNAFSRNEYSLDDPFGLASTPSGVPSLPAASPARSPYTLVPGGGTPSIPATAYATPAAQLNQSQPKRAFQRDDTGLDTGLDPGLDPGNVFEPAPGFTVSHPEQPVQMQTQTQTQAHTQNAAGRGVPPEQYFRDYLTNFGVRLRQSDPTGWSELVHAMNVEGYPVTLDSRPDGLHKGIHLNGQFIKLLDGYDNPIWQVGGGGDAGGGGGGGGGGTGATNIGGADLQSFLTQLQSGVQSGGAVDTQPTGPTSLNLGPVNPDPNAAITESSLAQIIGNYGATPFGQDIQQQLAQIIMAGGTNPSTDQQLIRARENAALAQQSMMEDTRSMLADRGTLSEPGIVQGPNEEAVANVARQIAPSYANAITDIETNAANLKQQSLMSSLQLATGMSADQSAAMLNAIGQGTNRTTALANISLGLLRENSEWNQFLATHGLDQAQLEADIQNNNWTHIIDLLNAFVAQGAVLNQGFID